MGKSKIATFYDVITKKYESGLLFHSDVIMIYELIFGIKDASLDDITFMIEDSSSKIPDKNFLLDLVNKRNYKYVLIDKVYNIVITKEYLIQTTTDKNKWYDRIFGITSNLSVMDSLLNGQVWYNEETDTFYLVDRQTIISTDSIYKLIMEYDDIDAYRLDKICRY